MNDKLFYDKLKELYGTMDDLDPQTPVLGSGKNLEALLKAQESIPNFEMVGSPQDLDPNFRMRPSQPAEFVSDMGKELVPSGGTMPQVFETTARQLPSKSLMQKLGPQALSALMKTGKYAIPPAALAADMATMEELGEGSDIFNSPKPATAERGAEALAGLESAYADMFKQPEKMSTQDFRMAGMTDTPEQMPAEQGQDSVQQFINKYKRQEDNSLKNAQAEEGRLMAMLLQNKSQSDLLSGLFDAASRAGSAIAGTQYDPNIAQSLRKMSEGQQQSGQADLAFRKTQRQEAEAKKDKQLERRMAEIGLENIEALNDPNSPLAQQVLSLVKNKMGIDLPQGTSPYLLQKAGLPLGNIIQQVVASEDKKELKMLEVAAKKEKAIEKLADDKKKFARDLRKEINTGEIGKILTTYYNTERFQDSFNQFAKNPSGYKDFATLMGGLKVFQGDESVVREAEMKMGMRAGSLKEKIKNEIDSLQSGKMLQPRQRKDIIDTIRILGETTKDVILSRSSSIIKQAKDEGIPLNIILPEELVPLVEERMSKEPPTAAPYGQKVMQNGKTYTWNGKEYVEGK